MSDERYIHIARWNDFQHYSDRDPKWIKVYTRLISDEHWLTLTGNRRAILLGLWLEYATSHSGLPHDTRILTRRLNLKVTTPDIEALNHAGFITIRASAPLAKRSKSASPDKEERTLKSSLSKTRTRVRATTRTGSARARQENTTNGPAVCPECGIGAGQHLADCPTVERRTVHANSKERHTMTETETTTETKPGPQPTTVTTTTEPKPKPDDPQPQPPDDTQDDED